MLYRVEVENFFSFCERQAIDLRARKSLEDPLGRLAPLHGGSEWVCPSVVALFGPNAAGKSNALKAIAFAAWFVTKSFEHRASHVLPYQKFGTAEKIADTTRISLSFSGPADFHDQTGDGPECPYTYELVLSGRGARPAAIPIPVQDRVVLEKLTYQPKGRGKPTTIVERRENSRLRHVRGFLMKGQTSALHATQRPNASIFSTLAQLNHQFASNFVKSTSQIMYNIPFDRLENDEILAARWYANAPKGLADLQSMAKCMDLGIEGIRVMYSSPDPMLEFSHSGLEEKICLPFESHGTRQFVKLFPCLHHALEMGSIAVIDDIDSAIHPQLLNEVVQWFSDDERNPRRAQIWMTCQSPSLMNELTKEGILFCEKNSRGCSDVYGLKDIERVRRNENFYGKYMGGVYGAVPRFG